MIRLKRRSEEVALEGNSSSPILLHRMFVISQEGDLIHPEQERDVVPLGNQDEDRLLWDEEYRFRDDAIAIEIICTKFGNLFGLVYSPDHCSLPQVASIEELLNEHGLSLAGDRDDYEQMLIHKKVRKFLSEQ